MSVRLANTPVSWGVDFADAPKNPHWRLVLDEIRDSGYEWMELGPVGYLPTDPTRLQTELASRGLHASGTFVFQPLHDLDKRAEVERVAEATCKAITASRGGTLVIIDLVSNERLKTAGRVDDARRLTDGEWDVLLEGVVDVAATAREHGLRPVFHPHTASYVEFEDEIERLLSDLGRETVQLCIDTGHSAYAGFDPVAFYQRHAERVPYLHLKDIDPKVRQRALAERLNFWQAMTAGIFCPLGSGMVDFAALGQALERHGFDGFATVEQDVDPSPDAQPMRDAITSREFLTEIGMAPMEPTRS
jgi:inosose dehydratase